MTCFTIRTSLGGIEGREDEKKTLTRHRRVEKTFLFPLSVELQTQ